MLSGVSHVPRLSIEREGMIREELMMCLLMFFLCA